MQCPHCYVEFHQPTDSEGQPSQKLMFVGEEGDGNWTLFNPLCPKCKKRAFYLRWVGRFATVVPGVNTKPEVNVGLIYPRRTNRPPTPLEVPAHIAQDYREACLTLNDSPKASAALSRRCLQNILLDAAKTKKKDLIDQIQEVLDSGQLPSHIADSIDAIRNIGNFAAHPIKSQSAGTIQPVEENEAEWNLDVLEFLFDFYYVQPEKTKTRKEALNKKLEEAGKPRMK